MIYLFDKLEQLVATVGTDDLLSWHFKVKIMIGIKLVLRYLLIMTLSLLFTLVFLTMIQAKKRTFLNSLKSLITT